MTFECEKCKKEISEIKKDGDFHTITIPLENKTHVLCKICTEDLIEWFSTVVCPRCKTEYYDGLCVCEYHGYFGEEEDEN